jgi:chromosome segregation ATPase
MLKKVLIAGLAVTVGVAVLAWISPPLFDWVCHTVKTAREGAENAIPLEQRIDILKDKLKDFDKEKVKYFDQVAHAEREVDILAKDVKTSSDNLASRWTDIQNRRDQLDTQKTRLVVGSKDREAFEKKLSRDFETYQIDEKTLEAKKDLLDARTKALEDGKSQLATLESRKMELSAKLTRMEDDLKLVRERQAQSNLNVNSNELTKLDAEADELAGKVTDQKRSLELQEEFGARPSDPTADKPAAELDIQKQIDDYKAAHQDAPQPDVVGKK